MIHLSTELNTEPESTGDYQKANKSLYTVAPCYNILQLKKNNINADAKYILTLS